MFPPSTCTVFLLFFYSQISDPLGVYPGIQGELWTQFYFFPNGQLIVPVLIMKMSIFPNDLICHLYQMLNFYMCFFNAILFKCIAQHYTHLIKSVGTFPSRSLLWRVQTALSVSTREFWQNICETIQIGLVLFEDCGSLIILFLCQLLLDNFFSQIFTAFRIEKPCFPRKLFISTRFSNLFPLNCSK